MANLKNIADLPVAESAKGLNLIVNDNGAAKQIAASAVGAQADWAETDENSPAFIKNKPKSAQPDWNQNDPSAPDYVKNRTHYTETETILERQIVEPTVEDGGYWLDLPYFNVPIGETVLVYWDGSTHELTVEGDDVGLWIGNVDTLGFSIGTDFGTQTAGVDFTGECAPHEIGIIRETIHKIDAKYLPNSGGYSFAFKNARYKRSNTYYFVDKGLYDAIKRGEAPPGVFTEFDEEFSNMLNLFTPRYYLVDEFTGGISVSLMLGSEVSSRQVFICDTDEHAFDHYDR